MRDDTLGLGIVGEPEREVEQRQAIVEEGAAARLRTSLSPSLIGAAMVVRAGPDPGELSELVAAQEAGERLDVAAEAVVVRHQHLSPARVRPR